VSQPVNSALDLLNQAASGRKVWIWGAGNQGRGICQVLRAQSVNLGGFLDSATPHQGAELMELPVHSPDDLLHADFTKQNFVIIAAFFFEKEIADRCSAAGLVQDQDFLFYSQLKPNDYSVDISGACNLKCIACPRASRSSAERKPGFMPLDTFRRVLDKIVEESPFVGNIQLYQWGEPMLHPQLPEIIAYAHSKGVRCAISSNLNAPVDYARILAAKPEWLRISASGWGDDYEVTHTKGRWPVFLDNLRTVCALRQEIHPEMKVEVYYHLYKHSVGDGVARFRTLCQELGVEMHPIYAYLVSLDDVLGYCEGKALPEPARQASELLLLDLDEGIDISRRSADQACDALRCININWDASVSTCMMYYYPESNVAAPDYFTASLTDIQSQRVSSDLCRRCMGHGIHQYCSTYARLDSRVAAAPIEQR